MNLQIYAKSFAGLAQELRNMARRELNRVTDRHLARCKQNTDVGDSPDSPTLRGRWDRSGVQETAGGFVAEVFNPTEYASYYEYGHRQTPGRVVFIELRAGAQKYGRKAQLIKSGSHAGKWGIYITLKKPYVKGRLVMTESEQQARQELDRAALRIEALIKKRLGGD